MWSAECVLVQLLRFCAAILQWHRTVVLLVLVSSTEYSTVVRCVSEGQVRAAHPSRAHYERVGAVERAFIFDANISSRCVPVKRPTSKFSLSPRLGGSLAAEEYGCVSPGRTRNFFVSGASAASHGYGACT